MNCRKGGKGGSCGKGFLSDEICVTEEMAGKAESREVAERFFLNYSFSSLKNYQTACGVFIG